MVASGNGCDKSQMKVPKHANFVVNLKIMRILKYLFSFLTLLGFASCDAQSSAGEGAIAEHVSPDVFAKGIASGDVIVLDVRTPGEYQSGHIDGAQLMNIADRDFADQLGKLDKTKPVYVYCRSGARSSNAMRQMVSLGFTEVYNLQGGILSWSAKGQPVAQ